MDTEDDEDHDQGYRTNRRNEDIEDAEQTETVDQNQNEDSAPEETETENLKGQSDDKCIGNRKRRTWILCVLLLAFGVFAAGYLFLLISSAKKRQNTDTGCAVCDESAKSKVSGANTIVAGLILVMIFCVVTMYLVCLPKCDPNKTKGGCFPGFGLFFSGGLYIFGWIWFIGADKDMTYKFLTDAEKEDADAEYLALFGEALLFAATAILLGVDLMIPHRYLLEDEFKRLFCNLGILCAQSILTMPAYFILAGIEEGVEMIGAGYIIICISTSTYIILYFTSCCCDVKDKPVVRIILAVGIIIGGAITAIGYYIFAGDVDTLGDPGDDAKRVAYYVGYTILSGGLCTVWGLDIAWDDIKND